MIFLIDVLSQYIFSGVSSNIAYESLKHILTKVNSKDWETIYLDAFQDSIAEMQATLQTYSLEGEIHLDRSEMSKILYQDLNLSVEVIPFSKLSSDAFTTKLADAMQKRDALIIGGNNLSLEDYKQLVRNLIKHANIGFKNAILSNEMDFKKTLLSEIGINQGFASEILVQLSNRFETTMTRLDIIERKVEQLRPLTHSNNETAYIKSPIQNLDPISSHPKEITENSPLLIGTLIDVSRSMINTLDSIPKRSGLSRNKLEKAINTILEKAILYCKTPESEDVLPKISLFSYAYGFGPFRTRVNNILNRLGIQSTNVESVHRQTGPIRDLFAEIALAEELPLTPNVFELDQHLDLYKKSVEAQIVDAGIGPSLLFEGLQVVYDRFYQELANPYYEYPILLIISDGGSISEGKKDIDQVISNLRQLGIQIVCCYLGAKNITKSRMLYSNPDSRWPHEALQLFNFASNVSESNQITQGIIEMARENSWQISDDAHLFIQINQTKTLEDFVGFILSSLRD